MTDQERREKVIKGLECHFLIEMAPCEKCPYYCKESCTDELAKDALALLKAQEAGMVNITMAQSDGWKEGNCPFCGMKVDNFYNWSFCGTCGRKVKWE